LRLASFARAARLLPTGRNCEPLRALSHSAEALRQSSSFYGVAMSDAEVREDWRAAVGEAAVDGGLAEDMARAREPGRGRLAESPTQIPARGWADIFWRVLWSIGQDRLLSTAGAVAFFSLLAVFPAIAAIVSLYGLIADARTIAAHMVMLSGILPFGVLDVISGQVAFVLQQRNEALGAAFAISVVIAFVSANSGIVSLFDALNVVYKEREKRSYLRFYATTFLFTTVGFVFVIAVIAAVVVFPLALQSLGFLDSEQRLLSILRWPSLFLVVAVSLACLYRFGPSRSDARWQWVSWGSAFAAIFWMAASMLFSTYVSTFDSYNRVYGSLGAGVGFMVWLWISAVVILIGGELNAEMEHQTARDTTTGRPKPLGRRGAVVADHVGEARE
jgi:membrane protein